MFVVFCCGGDVSHFDDSTSIYGDGGRVEKWLAGDGVNNLFWTGLDITVLELGKGRGG